MYIYVTRRLLYNKQQLLIPREHLSSPLSFGGIRVAIFLVFCIVLLCVFTFLLPCCDIHYDSCIETMFGSSIPPVVCRRVHDLFTLFVFTHSGAQHLLYCVFCFVCLRLVCCAPSFSRLSVLIASSVSLTFISRIFQLFRGGQFYCQGSDTKVEVRTYVFRSYWFQYQLPDIVYNFEL
jgi:hypothetical protein